MKYTVKLIPQKIIYIIFLIFAFSLSSGKAEESKKFTVQGTKELGGSISYQRINPVFNGRTGGATTIFSLAPYFGFFVFKEIEIGVNPCDLTLVSQSGNTTIQTMIFVAPSYNLKVVDKVYLFIETQIGYTHKSCNGYNEDGFSWGSRTGAKLALTNNGLLNLSLQYLSVTMNPEEASDRNGFNQLLLSVGWTVWF